MANKIGRKDLSGISLPDGLGLISKISTSNLPTDGIMSVIKKLVTYRISQFMSENSDILIDQNDLKYQTLFRLASYDITDIFYNGDILKGIMTDNGYYNSWLNISKLSERAISHFEINTKVLDSVINEQYSIIRRRLSKSKLPLDEILSKSKISSNDGWYIHKNRGELFAIKGRHSYSSNNIYKIDLKEVNIDYANKVFNDLHYIHTPRATKAFGLFIRNEDTPFSIAGFAPIDRPYKKSILFNYGYNPDNCWEFVRLYSKPGAPMNTSSSFLSASIRFLSNEHPEIEAYLSAFTPSFASGKSMIAGGFNNVILAKDLRLSFGSVTVPGKYERLTNRRLESYTGSILESKLPILPTLELLRPVIKPSKHYAIEDYTVIM